VKKLNQSPSPFDFAQGEGLVLIPQTGRAEALEARPGLPHSRSFGRQRIGAVILKYVTFRIESLPN
jgi:hypothetical protein